MSSSTQPSQEITDFSIEILDDMHLSQDVDFCSFDESFDNVMDEMVDLERSQHNDLSQCVTPSSLEDVFQDAMDVNVDETMNDPAPAATFSQEYFNETSSNNTHFYDTNVNVTTGSTTAAPFNSPEDLDGQIKNSMSKLVESMHRSEMSRNMLHGQQSSSGMFGFGSFLNMASGIAQHQSNFKNYMNHVGNSSAL